MNRFFTLFFAASCLTAVGQQDLWEYPFPYNPDGNADGYIGLNDMLDLLSVYGQAYPESFYSDSSRAILDLGVMTYSECNQQAWSAGISWRVMAVDDFHYWFQYLLASGQVEFESSSSGSSNLSAWLRLNDGDPGTFNLRYDSDYSIDFAGGTYNLYPNDAFVFYEGQKENGNDGRYYPLSNRRCYLTSQVVPEVQYFVVQENSCSATIEAVSDSLSNGWKIAGGASRGLGSDFNCMQGIWRFAQ